MDDSKISQLIDITIGEILKTKSETNSEFEKFRIALSNIFRLLTDQRSSTLVKLQGQPKDLISYIIQMTNNLQESINSAHDGYLSNLTKARNLLE
ncbi:MAG: hypothetical protein BAJATHORv1_20512 [Candidatus Thorarchaeota archaeon]|nr:MAG: hypothetical protein BAJATHORv1_20512 [Candidatus Thorarchaeota archaeon]